MQHSKLFIILSIALLVTTGATIVIGRSEQEAEDRMFADRAAELGIDLPAVSAPAASTPAAVATAATPAEPELTPDAIQKLMNEMPRLSEIPWDSQKLTAAFRSSGSRTCRLLPPDIDVNLDPDASPLQAGKPDGTRVTVLTIGLRVDPRNRKDLPRLSRSSIESYLSDHQLAVQPLVYRDEAGMSFGGLIQSAFFARRSPRVSLAAEPMIGEALQGLRVLGAIPIAETNPETATTPPRPRTIVVAFRFTQSSKTQATTGLVTSEPEYELLFLHLLKEQQREVPRLAAFCTNEGRQQIHELDLNGIGTSSMPTIVADIRFDDFTLAGLYPASPVVTGVHPKILASQAIDSFQEKLKNKPVSAISDMFDDWHEQTVLITGSRSKAP